MAYSNAMDFSPIFNYGSRIFQYSINDHPPSKSDLITHLEPEQLSDRVAKLARSCDPGSEKVENFGRKWERARESGSKRKWEQEKESESDRKRAREREWEKEKERETLSLSLSLARAFAHFLPKLSTFSDPGSQDRAISATLMRLRLRLRLMMVN